VSLLGKVMLETRNYSITVKTELEEAFVEVKQIAVLVSLKQCPQLGSKQFLRLERDNPGLRLMPVVVDLERIGFQAVEILVLISTLSLSWLPLSASGVNLKTRCTE
jgi:hypothetical protein